MRVLAIADELTFDPQVLTGLAREGFAVDLAPDLADGDHMCTSTHYDLMILDIKHPRGAGLEFLKKVRNGRSDIPIIVLSPAATVVDRIAGLTAGADDYLTKPFDLAELIARMRATLRRPGRALGRELRFDGLVFNTLNATVEVDSRPLAVPRRELAILESLMRANGRVVTKPALEATAYAQEDSRDSNVLEANVSRLRRRMKEAGADIDIKVVRGVGYRLDCTQPRGDPPDQYCRVA